MRNRTARSTRLRSNGVLSNYDPMRFCERGDDVAPRKARCRDSVDQENRRAVPFVQIGQAVTFDEQVFVTTFERVHREMPR